MRRYFALIVACGIFVGGSSQAATIIGAAKASGDFTKLLAAGHQAGVDVALDGRGPFTLFAPNDAAFDKIPPAKLQTLMMPANVRALKTALGAHLLTGVLSMQAIEKGLADNDAVAATTVNNMPLIFKREGGAITVNGAHIIKGPMTVDNGLVYVIDTVLLPPKPLQPTY
jgi:uncharacterized surface protein with fasciclin (FAS1) repeats